MNRRQLFLSSAKAALATAFGGSWLINGAKAQTPATATAGAAAAAPMGSGIGSPAGTRTIPGDVLPPLDLPGAARRTSTPPNPRRGGRRAWCRPPARRTSC